MNTMRPSRRWREYQQRMSVTATRKGYVEDLVGRRRYLPEMTCPIPRIRAEGERMAGNMPVQSPRPKRSSRWQGIASGI